MSKRKNWKRGLRNPLKQWKITESDITEPNYYEQYMEAYEEAWMEMQSRVGSMVYNSCQYKMV